MEQNVKRKYNIKSAICFSNANNLVNDKNYSFLPHSIIYYYHNDGNIKQQKRFQCLTMNSFAFFKLKRLNELKWIVNKIENKPQKFTDPYLISKIYYRYSFILADNKMKRLANYYLEQCNDAYKKVSKNNETQKNKLLLEKLKNLVSSIKEDKGAEYNKDVQYYFTKGIDYSYKQIQNQIKVKVLFLPSQDNSNNIDINIYPKIIYLDQQSLTPENIVKQYNQLKFEPEIKNDYKCFIYESEDKANFKKCVIFQTMVHYLNKEKQLYFPLKTFRELKQNEKITNKKPFVIITHKNSNFINMAQYTENKLLTMNGFELQNKAGVAGFTNLGNTCYMNASFQCIVHCPLLVKHFLLDYKDRYSRSSSSLVKAFYNFLQEVWKLGTRTVTPSSIRQEFVTECKKFNDKLQHDSPEMISDFLNLLGNHLTDDSKKYAYLPSHDKAEIAKIQHKNEDNSIIDELFYGVLENKFMCPHCKTEKLTHEAFLLLDIPIPNKGKGVKMDLNECFKFFTEEQKPDKNNILCKECKRKVGITTKLAILPQYLLVYLKKFRVEGRCFRKYQTDVEYDETLVIKTDWTAKGQQKYEYELMSVSIHHGNVEGGHYIAKAKVNNEWKMFNDSSVKDGYGPHDSDALVLFYKRKQKAG